MRPPRTPPEFHTWTMSDGYPLRGRAWRTGVTAAPVCLIYLHGIQSHGGWFEWSASLLSESGSPVLLPDRRGSGLNAAARGDTPSVERWLADIDELADWAATEFAVRRFAVVGVSWGGKLAVAWALRRCERVERLLLVAPGLFPAVDLGLLAKLRVGLALVAGHHRQFGIPLHDPALFTDNPAGQRFIIADPLKLCRVTARFLYCSRLLDRRLSRVGAAALKTPTTLLLSGRDRIIRNLPTEAWLRRVAAQTPEIKTAPECAHTREFEPEVAAFAAELQRWATGGRDSSAGSAARNSGATCNRGLPTAYNPL
jgi:acylglycerol lipase